MWQINACGNQPSIIPKVKSNMNYLDKYQIKLTQDGQGGMIYLDKYQNERIPMDFLEELAQAKKELIPMSSGCIDPKVEAKIRANVCEVCERLYKVVKKHVDDKTPIPHPKDSFKEFEGSEERLFLSYEKFLSNFRLLWSKDFAQEVTFGKELDQQKSLIKLATLDYIQGRFYGWWAAR